MLAATLACLSYVPFEYVAKGSLLFAILLFIVDPIPPLSRLLSLLLVGVVGIISKMHRRHRQDEIDGQYYGVTIVTDRNDQSDETTTSSIVELNTTSESLLVSSRSVKKDN